MNFSWASFCKEHRIDYISSGAHSAKGNWHIHCPWCGDQDRSYHMGLSLDTRKPFYGCWRTMSHRGRNPARLIAALLGCTWDEATQLVEREDTSAVDSYEAAVARVLAVTRAEDGLVAEEDLLFPESFRPMYDERRSAERYLDYLVGRGFNDPISVAETYDLHYCTHGEFGRRLILPIYHEGRLVNWTGRDVTGLAKLRYNSLSDKPDVAKRQGANTPAPMSLTSTVFNHDRAERGGDALVVCEGPFDGLKIDWYAPEDSCGVAVFGMPKSAQLSVLVKLARNFDRVLVMLDAAALSNSLRLAWDDLGALLGSAVRWVDLPQGVKDPGALSARAVRLLLRSA